MKKKTFKFSGEFVPVSYGSGGVVELAPTDPKLKHLHVFAKLSDLGVRDGNDMDIVGPPKGWRGVLWTCGGPASELLAQLREMLNP